MTATGRPTTDTGQPRSSYQEPTAWTGWVAFAGFMMILLGAFQAIEGLVAIFQDDYYLVRSSGLVVNIDYSVWGWVHLLLGAVLVVSGFGVLVGNPVARAVGVVFAMLSALLNLAFVAAYPVWSIVVIAVDIVVIYALTAHGGEMRREDRGLA